MKKIGFYAGSFDPFTKGHLYVVMNAADLFDKVIIGVADNSSKSRRFNKDDMCKAIEKAIEEDYPSLEHKVKVYPYVGLTTDIAKKLGATHLIRGIRNGMDYEYEENIASINKEISDLDTIYFRAESYGNVSSSMVMELFKHGKDVNKYVPYAVLEYMRQNK